MKEGYTPTIGLEIHAELKTKTKMFCKCRNDPEEKKPNVNMSEWTSLESKKVRNERDRMRELRII